MAALPLGNCNLAMFTSYMYIQHATKLFVIIIFSRAKFYLCTKQSYLLIILLKSASHNYYPYTVYRLTSYRDLSVGEVTCRACETTAILASPGIGGTSYSLVIIVPACKATYTVPKP